MPPGSLPPYNPDDFPRVAVTVDVVVFTIRHDELHVLLVERGQEPFMGSWALPGGFVQPKEDLDCAAARELQEETNLSADGLYLEQLGSYGTPGRDPRMRVITVAYWAVCAELEQPRGGGDAAYSDLVPVAKIERGGIRLAFDHHRIVGDAVRRLRAKLEYTPLATTFCPPRFTISQLRGVYETIWGTRLDPGNFQRKIRRNPAFKHIPMARTPSRRRGGRPASLWSIPRQSAIAADMSPMVRRPVIPDDESEE